MEGIEWTEAKAEKEPTQGIKIKDLNYMGFEREIFVLCPVLFTPFPSYLYRNRIRLLFF